MHCAEALSACLDSFQEATSAFAVSAIATFVHWVPAFHAMDRTGSLGRQSRLKARLSAGDLPNPNVPDPENRILFPMTHAACSWAGD